MIDNEAGRSNLPPRNTAKRLLRWLLALSMVWIGIKHFTSPALFESIVPNYLPVHHALVLISGFFEIAGGIGLLLPFVRRAAGLGLVLLYIAVFPANINMALHPPPGYDTETIRVILWLRLPLQALLIAWALWVSRDENAMDKKTISTS